MWNVRDGGGRGVDEVVLTLTLYVIGDPSKRVSVSTKVSGRFSKTVLAHTV
jgi:hypothetical protein